MLGFLRKKNKGHLKPGFLITGAQKAGTTALFDYLSKHPAISAPSVKEIDFFNCESRFKAGTGFYHSHFPVDGGKGMLTFEASPGYLLSSRAPERIREYNPDIRLMVILREPVERAFSAWNMYKKEYKRDREWFHRWMERCDKNYKAGVFTPRDVERFDSFDFAVREEIALLEHGWKFDFAIGEEPSLWGPGRAMEAPIVQIGQYSEQLEKYLNLFDKGRILILDYKALQSDTKAVLRQVEGFLNLSFHNWDKEDLSPVFKGEYESDIPSGTRGLLNDYYKPYNERLFKIIGRSFGWEKGGR